MIASPTQPSATPAPGATAREPTERTAARQVLRRMTLEQKVGQVFMLGFDGVRLNPGNRALVSDLRLGGVTLFARNVESAQQLQQLTRDLQAIADPVPLFVSIDQEGGLVVRMTEQQGATVFPGEMSLGASGDASLTRRVAEASARELQALGINMNLAPVVDVNTNPANPVIGIRSFGGDPGLVSTLATATIEGQRSVGIASVAKHFPGHGDTSVDSHLDLPLVPYPMSRLESVELEPFRAAIRAGVDGVMTAHLVVPAVEPNPDIPATLSRAVLTGLLREKLGYPGLILTDALDMGAILRDRTAAQAAVQAFEAGADMLLIAGITQEDRNRLGEGPRALLEAVQNGRISQARLDESVLRVLEAKAKRGLLAGTQPAGDLSIVGSAANRALAQEAANRGATLIRDDAGVLPLRRAQRVLVVTPDAATRSPVVDDGDRQGGTLAARLSRLAGPATEVNVSARPNDAEIARAVAQARQLDVVVLATYDLPQQDPAQMRLARALSESGKPVVGVALRGPYDASAAPFIRTWIAVYGDRAVNLQAAASLLAGALQPTGKLPVQLP